MNEFQYVAPVPKKELWIVSVIKAALYILLYMGIMFAVSLFDVVRLTVIGMQNGMTEAEIEKAALANSYPTMIISALLTLLILVMYTLAKKRPLREEFCLKPVKPSLLVLVFVTGISLNLTLSVLMSLLPEKVIESYNQSMEVNTSFGIYLLAAVIMAPIIEETVFRCFAITRMKRSLPIFVSIILSSLAFGGVHGHWVQMLYAGTLGIVLALLFCRTESIIPSVVMHFAFNSVSLLSFLTAEAVGESVYNTVNLVYGLAVVASLPLSAVCIMLIVLVTARSKQRNEPRYTYSGEFENNGDNTNAG